MARIAIVDDDRMFCETVARQLAEAGHECIIQSNGERAFDTLKEARPDVILVALMMSRVSGFRLCRMIRRDSMLYLVPIIVSAIAEDEHEVRYCKRLGADESIEKPVAVGDLMSKVQKQLLSIEEIKKRDPTTGLPGLEAIKKEVNHRLARNQKIAACYLGVPNIGEVTRAHSSDPGVVNQLARETADLMYRIAEKLQIYEMLVGYIGAAHFVVVLKPGEYEPFCKRFVKSFDSDLAFRWRRGLASASQGGEMRKGATPAVPRVSIGVTHNINRAYTSVDTLFMMLSQVQREAQSSTGSSYLVCRCPVPV
jgi:CheY-like chemotaxis protein